MSLSNMDRLPNFHFGAQFQGSYPSEQQHGVTRSDAPLSLTLTPSQFVLILEHLVAIPGLIPSIHKACCSHVLLCLANSYSPLEKRKPPSFRPLSLLVDKFVKFPTLSEV